MFCKSGEVRKNVSSSDWGFDDTTKEYFITIDLSDTDTFKNFKNFTSNKFYQVQLYFTDSSISTINGTIDLNWLQTYKNNISESSQSTLIRKIIAPTITFDQFDINSATEETVYDFFKLSGKVANTDSQVDTIDRCKCTITEENNSSRTWTCSRWITSTNNGTEFSIPINNNIIIEGATYQIVFEYYTTYGYYDTLTKKITYHVPSSGTNLQVTAQGHVESGSILIVSPEAKTGRLQRYEKINSWKTVCNNFDSSWRDYSIQSDVQYTYRLVDSSNKTGSYAQAEVSFEDIFLSDENGMVAIRFNPVISGLKYVTQESIVNTLGGKYPVISKNGATKYRQFTLSGVIDNTIYAEYESKDSCEAEFITINHGSLFLRFSSSLQLPTSIDSFEKRQKVERAIRNATVEMLSNGKPKLFRSFEEGNMIVHLSNISFTPNKTLGRHVYDFSATVTEMCEYNEDNVAKYHLNLNSFSEPRVSE
jgi:hypothetical protein